MILMTDEEKFLLEMARDLYIANAGRSTFPQIIRDIKEGFELIEDK